MVTEEFVCMLCGTKLNLDKSDLEEFVPGRIWGLTHEKELHHCGHESAFAKDEPLFAAFVAKEGDKAAQQLSKFEFSKWKGKMQFHMLERGVESKDYFKQILKELVEEIDFILKSEKIPNPEEKIRLIILDKLEPYREIIKIGKAEQKTKEEWGKF